MSMQMEQTRELSGTLTVFSLPSLSPVPAAVMADKKGRSGYFNLILSCQSLEAQGSHNLHNKIDWTLSLSNACNV
jgi:hypothetical protein